ncbi:MAG: hypothetical protein KatS3mg026_0008 [Bacteroidia bacterium]|nr:MAG: hypothetical protein KatS3mg026_0008 [Bacteroidia bacterium]
MERGWTFRLRHWPGWQSGLAWALFVVLMGSQALLRRRDTPSLPDSARIDLNTADSLCILAVPGLRPWHVSRLLHWRTQLGGFWNLEEVELLLDSATFRKAFPYLTVQGSDTTPVQFINLNQADSATFVALHLCRPRSAGSLLRWRHKLGGFSDWAAVDSLRSLHPLERYRLRRWGLLLPHPRPEKLRRPRPSAVDLNRATPSDLEKLPGIGLYTAERIVKYREKLRYFVSVDQLREVWGLRPENLEKARPFLYVGPPLREPLRLRVAPAESLAAHPYISWKLARWLVRRREAWGPGPIPPDAWKNWLPDSVRTRIEPYLTGD